MELSNYSYLALLALIAWGLGAITVALLTKKGDR
jgi:hypothetical protein